MFSANNSSPKLTEKLLFMQDLEITAVTALSLCGAYLPNMQQKMTDRNTYTHNSFQIYRSHCGNNTTEVLRVLKNVLSWVTRIQTITFTTMNILYLKLISNRCILLMCRQENNSLFLISLWHEKPISNHKKWYISISLYCCHILAGKMEDRMSPVGFLSYLSALIHLNSYSTQQ